MKIVLVAGARPNFMKIAPIIKAIVKARDNGNDIDFSLVHTGQHYDEKMSQQFFDQLNIPKPDINLNVGSGSQAQQTADIMVTFEKYLIENKCDLLIVVGDVNSTLATSLVAKKMDIDVAHVEAGIRSGDRTMPEELNRLATDAICDYFFTTSRWASKNLIHSGIAKDKIFFVGNTMIDTLVANKSRFKKPILFDSLDLKSKNYIVLTLHRPSNVDDAEQLKALMNAFSLLKQKIVFPCHPRTLGHLEQYNISMPTNLHIVEPLGYLEFMYMVSNAGVVITDSGGIQEETTFLNVPCITLRNNTERPETVEIGTNILLGDDASKIEGAVNKIYADKQTDASIPELWDGQTSTRIVDICLKLYR